MTIIYPAVFSLEDGAYNVSFPDLPGCLTYGDSVEDAFFNAREALAGYSASVLERGGILPAPSGLSTLCLGPDQLAQLVDAKPACTQAAVKKTLTIPSWLNQRAEAAHAPYSRLLQEALEKYLDLA